MVTLDPGRGLEERFVTLPDGRRFRYVAGGTSGPLVVFEAGMGASSGTWVVVQRMLSGRARTIAYDRSGTAGSDPDRRGVARDLDRLVEDLGSFLGVVAPDEPVVLVGHSWGGPIIRALAHRSPERVAGLVLVDGSNEVSLATLPGWFVVGTFGAVRLLTRLGFRNLGPRIFRGGHPWPEVSDADTEIAVRDMRSVDSLGYIQDEARALTASLPGLKELDAMPLPPMPVAYLLGTDMPKWGRASRESMVGGIKALHAVTPTSRLAEIDGAGHGILLEQPSATVAEIGLILDQIPSGATSA